MILNAILIVLLIGGIGFVILFFRWGKEQAEMDNDPEWQLLEARIEHIGAQKRESPDNIAIAKANARMAYRELKKQGKV